MPFDGVLESRIADRCQPTVLLLSWYYRSVKNAREMLRNGVTVLWIYRGVIVVLSWCSNGFTGVLPVLEVLLVVQRVLICCLQECHKSVTGVSQKCYTSVTRVSQECHKRVTRVSQECHKSVTRVSQECHKSVTRVSQECHKSVTRVSQECYKSVTRVSQECYRSVTRVSQECHRSVSIVLKDGRSDSGCGNCGASSSSVRVSIARGNSHGAYCGGSGGGDMAGKAAQCYYSVVVTVLSQCCHSVVTVLLHTAWIMMAVTPLGSSNCFAMSVTCRASSTCRAA
jgi:histone H3/H4